MKIHHTGYYKFPSVLYQVVMISFLPWCFADHETLSCYHILSDHVFVACLFTLLTKSCMRLPEICLSFFEVEPVLDHFLDPPTLAGFDVTQTVSDIFSEEHQRILNSHHQLPLNHSVNSCWKNFAAEWFELCQCFELITFLLMVPGC